MTFADDAKRWFNSVTIWFSAALVVAGAVVEYLNTVAPELTPYFGKWGPLATVTIGVLNVLLRLRTSKPIGKPLRTGGPYPPVRVE
jgi:hypothetical protein